MTSLTLNKSPGKIKAAEFTAVLSASIYAKAIRFRNRNCLFSVVSYVIHCCIVITILYLW
jgi:hypothetical protein